MTTGTESLKSSRAPLRIALAGRRIARQAGRWKILPTPPLALHSVHQNVDLFIREITAGLGAPSCHRRAAPALRDDLSQLIFAQQVLVYRIVQRLSSTLAAIRT